MKKLVMFVILAAIVSLPAAVIGAPNDDAGKLKVKKEKTVPEPAAMLLVGAAAVGLVGVRKLLRSKRQ